MEFRDLKAQYNKYKVEIDSAIQKVVNNMQFINGNETIAHIMMSHRNLIDDIICN